MRLASRASVPFLVATTLLALSTGCTDKARYDQAICVLIDESGTYADQKQEVVRILKSEVLPSMEPGDTLLVIRIDGESYQKENVEALLTLDTRPSRANAQKLALARTLDELARRRLKSVHTDIPGAMMLGNEYLGELASGSRVMLVFSDMQEDLAPGTRRDLSASEFDGVWVAAMNVKRLGSDNADPSVFRKRMSTWKRRVLQSGGLGWRTFMDASQLADYLGEVRASAENRRRAPSQPEGASA